MHLKFAKYLENDGSRQYRKIAFNYYLGGNINESAIFYLKEIEELLNSGCYNSSSIYIDEFENKFEALIITNHFIKSEFDFLKARNMFHNVQYVLAKDAFSALLKYNNDNKYNAECHRWMARTLLKLESSIDFNNALDHLEEVKNYYNKTNDFSKLGDTLLDFIVAYGHSNNIEKANELYMEAEICYNLAKDSIGMLRLVRKSIIFMNAHLSAPLIADAANKWGILNIIHEKIMCLNNAAVQYFYIQDYNRSEQMLKEAIEESISFNDFGTVYLHNNMGLIQIFKGKYDLANKNLEEAKKGKYRLVEQLIVDINLSAVNFFEKGVKSTHAFLNEVYATAMSTDEHAYIIPATINLALSEIQMSNIERGIVLLESLYKCISKHYAHELYLWYRELYKLYQLNANSKIAILEEIYKKDVNIQKYATYPEFAYITMEYWSDN